MRKKVILITGAAGEVGQSLVKHLAETNGPPLLTLDIRDLPDEFKGMSTHLVGDILDKNLFSRLTSDYEIDRIFHLAALLSTRCEYNPSGAHRINVEGTYSLLELAGEQSRERGLPVIFIFPSSIAVYGMPDLDTKQSYSQVREFEWNSPITMYGGNKLYGEFLGRYYAENYQQLAEDEPVRIDFRCVRYPGLISAFTVPSGGTSDYASEMIHAAAQGQDYACFVREGLTIPFMAMPDAVDAVLKLADAPRESLTQLVYNIAGFSISAGEIRDLVGRAFPGTKVTFEPDLQRERIAESWPIDLDDSPARRDWGWNPGYDAERTFAEYLIPNIVKRYNTQVQAVSK
jgi:nucleoside-diphosphate-sugar epimerase